VRDLTIRLGPRAVLNAASLEVPAGTVTGVVGPNGSGKTSLLRAAYRALKPVCGTVRVGGIDVWTAKPGHVSRRLAALPQGEPSVEGQTVAELVALGLIPLRRSFGALGTGGQHAVAAALEAVGLGEAGDRAAATLSGGELQRARIARALARAPAALVLDEPTNHLDVHHQHQVLGLVRHLGLTALCALHDLALAARYCDALVLLDGGQVVAAGPPREVLTGPSAREAFGVVIEVLDHPVTGEPVVTTSPPVGGDPPP